MKNPKEKNNSPFHDREKVKDLKRINCTRPREDDAF
jgi:hypothetical protein